MTTVYEQVQILTAQYPPDDIRLEYPRDDEVFNYDQQLTPHRFWLEYGRMVVSIQCGQYNYCDYYRVGMGDNFNYYHPYTCTAEVAIFDRTLVSLRNHGWVLPYPDENPHERVFAWANSDTILDIVETIYAYTR